MWEEEKRQLGSMKRAAEEDDHKYPNNQSDSCRRTQNELLTAAHQKSGLFGRHPLDWSHARAVLSLAAYAKCRTNYQSRPTPPPGKRPQKGPFICSDLKPDRPRRTANNKMADSRGVIRKGHPRLLRSEKCFASDRVGARTSPRKDGAAWTFVLSHVPKAVSSGGADWPRCREEAEKKKSGACGGKCWRSDRGEEFRAGAGKR
ncbi:hypothetical protein pipiens_013583 [Culex pipiens pipiens]|uniref:Uncharacterized protein n=1 Tax=Culex pipiens pipiens TaxID=38569 RepID=A0ABD1CXZ1_CULPP